jgi:hypothetical protein
LRYAKALASWHRFITSPIEVARVGLSDVAGVFSRYFIVGFFLPAFFALVALAQMATSLLLPNGYEGYGDGTQILVLGGAGVLLGLFLLGLHFPILRLYEGYPLMSPPLRVVRRPLIWLQARPYKELTDRKKLATPEADEETQARGLAAWRKLDRFFPDDRSRLLPTRFGNALRAAEDYAYSRWRLDAIPFWAHVEPLLSDQERQLHENARTDMAFFVNSSLAAVVVGCVLVADEIAHRPLDPLYGWAYAIPFLLAYVFYRFAIGAAQRWGVEMRASIDLHRLEVYERLGIRRPESFSDERKAVAGAVNRLFLYAVWPPDPLWAAEPGRQRTTPAASEDSRRPAVPALRRFWLFGLGAHSQPREEVKE